MGRTAAESSTEPKYKWNTQWSRDYYRRKKAKDPLYYAESKTRRRNAKPDLYRSFETKWQQANPEKQAESMAAYLASDKGKNKTREMAARRRQDVRRQVIAKVHAGEVRKVYMECPQGLHVDHIVPLKHPVVCGLHVPWNLQYLTPSENQEKSNKLTEQGLTLARSRIC